MSDLVTVVLDLDRLSNDYLVQMSPGEALEFAERAEAHNALTAEALRQLVEPINARIPPMQFQPGNPNNGHPHHVYLVGNEGSRVLYLHIHKFYLEARCQGVAFDYQALALELKALGQRVLADEFWVTLDDELGFKFRFWWD